MKKLLLTCTILFTFTFSKAQTSCDSISIQCCTWDSVAPGTLTMYVTNNSSEFFNYPGFILFNMAMDTIAIDSVTYFGLAGSGQVHTFYIQAPLTLPFNGYLNLYSYFFDSLECSYPFSIADTSNSNPECDSVIVECCTWDSVAPGTLTIYVTNNSTELFSYPGFILFDAGMDTIAVESVNYFGIAGPQPHTLVIQDTLNLPFTGYLRLYSGFYDSLHCTWNFSIADTSTGNFISQTEIENSGVMLYPNPAADRVQLSLTEAESLAGSVIRISDISGREVFSEKVLDPDHGFSVSEFPGGIYFVKIENPEGRLYSVNKLVVVRP